MDGHLPALHSGAGRQISHFFKCVDELWSAIRITRIIHSINAKEDMPGTKHFCPSQRVSQEHCISGGDIGDRNLVDDIFCVGYRNTVIRQC